MKLTTIIALLFIAVSGYGQEQKRPTNLEMTISDTMFVSGLVPRIEAGIKVIQNSTIATKESLPVIQGLNEVITFMNNLITSQMSASSSTIDGGNIIEKPKGKAKSK